MSDGLEFFIRDREGNYLAQRRSAGQGSLVGLHRLWQPGRDGALLVSNPEEVLAAEFDAAELGLGGIRAELRQNTQVTA